MPLIALISDAYIAKPKKVEQITGSIPCTGIEISYMNTLKERIPDSFGELLTRLRLAYKLTQRQLAKKLAFHSSKISGFENNSMIPTSQDEDIIIAFFNISGSYERVIRQHLNYIRNGELKFESPISTNKGSTIPIETRNVLSEVIGNV